MRCPIICGVLLLLVLASPIPVQAGKKMEVQLDSQTAPTEQGHVFRGNGTVSDLADGKPIDGAVVSIQVIHQYFYQNEWVSVNATNATTYTNTSGEFLFSLLIPLPANSCGLGSVQDQDFVILIVVNKPGYDTAWLVMHLHSPWEFAVVATPLTLTVIQGQTVRLAITLRSGQFLDSIDLTATDLPPGVTVGFDPPSLDPLQYNRYGGQSNVTIAVSYTAPVGSHTIAILAGSSGLSHRVCIQLNIAPAPFAPLWVIVLACAGAGIGLAAIALSIRSPRRHDPVGEFLEG